jgi:hypothetical protein
MESLYATQRSKILRAYKDANQEFLANTKPYRSTVGLVGTLTTIDSAAGWAALEFLPQTAEFFSYKVGDPVPGYPVGARVATEADTNLSKPRTTNGTEDFVIEGMSLTGRGYRVDWSNNSATNGWATLTPSAGMLAAMSGQGACYDPGSWIVPPEFSSSINLENTLTTAILPYTAIEFEWDRSRVEKIGACDQIPEGAGKSFLRANGDPRTDNRYKIPEGYLWRREGVRDCEFVARVRIVEPVVMFYSIINPGALATFGTSCAPRSISLDLTMRLHGLSCKLPSAN